MFNMDFWFGFSVGVCTMFVIVTFVTVWFIAQAANFHDSWLKDKEKK